MMQYNTNRRRHAGFTLVELMVVIAIIVILGAILFPVFSSVREKARQSQCHANLTQIATAMKSFREDHGKYPVAPYYDATAHRYHGGVSELYPDYITERSVLICPDDQQIKGLEAEAKEKVYSSYNGWVKKPLAGDDASWDFEAVTCKTPDGGGDISGKKRAYNWLGYVNRGVAADHADDGWDAFYWNSAADTNMPYKAALPAWLSNEGLSYRHYPRLANRQAPDNTIITHCVHHRSHFKRPTDMMDVLVTVGGTAKLVNVKQMSEPGADAAHPNKWVKQSD